MSKPSEPRINQAIRCETVRLVDQNGEMIGVVAIEEALKRADQAGLDLVEISPMAEPPVCKILDYGKYKYEAQKKAHDARKKQKVIQIKEIKLRPNIDTHDLDIKIRNVIQVIEGGDKVRISLRFRGREMDHAEIGMAVLKRVQDALETKAKIESPPKPEGRQIIMTIGPK